jgi:gliding motility-associated-like protein
VEVKVNAKPVVDFTAPSALKAHTDILFANNSSLVGGWVNNFIWNFGDGTSSALTTPYHQFPAAGTYNVVLTAISDKGCVDSLSKTLVVDIGQNFLISNVMTTNDNGQNDTWYVEGLSQFTETEVTIVNRYGSEVYHAKPYLNDWDGTYEGKKLPDGTYFYVLKYTDSGVANTVKGALTIMH